MCQPAIVRMLKQEAHLEDEHGLHREGALVSKVPHKLGDLLRAGECAEDRVNIVHGWPAAQELVRVKEVHEHDDGTPLMQQSRQTKEDVLGCNGKEEQATACAWQKDTLNKRKAQRQAHMPCTSRCAQLGAQDVATLKSSLGPTLTPHRREHARNCTEQGPCSWLQPLPCPILLIESSLGCLS